MSFGSRVVAGLGWTAGGRLLGQLFAWGVSIVVIRILDPSDYGLLAMATVLIGFAGLFAELGLGWAVVQAKQVDTQVLRRVFGLILLVNGTLFALACLAAPLVAAFFGEERLTTIVRVCALQFLIAAPGAIPDALLQRELEFRRRSLVELSSTVVGGAATLGLALAGHGVWALVWGGLASAAWRAAGINLIRPFAHLPAFGFAGLGRLFAFGGHIAASRVLLFLSLQADVVIAGRLLGKEQTGYYSVGMHLASLPMQRVSAILNEVAFPAFARIQHDEGRVGDYLLRSAGLLSLCAFPVFWGIAAVAPELVGLLLGEKWQPAVLPLQLLASVMPLRMVAQLMPPTLQGMGKAALAARIQLLVCTSMIAAFLVGARYGIEGLSMAWVLAFPLVFLAVLLIWLPALGVSVPRLLAAMARPALAGAGMVAIVAVVRASGAASGAAGLAVLVLAGALAYAVLSWTTNRSGVHELLALFRRGRREPGPVAR